ncbi:DUF2184 domain-containing protein [Candidatus Bathyarchaeota archaeon]|nr:DUF2184 domain-containing protein [Candidatus Bathyarchaeota archaeon]
MSKYLHREDAPWGDDVWELLDKTAINAAKTQLSARKILNVMGPYGLGQKSLPGKEREVGEFRVSEGLRLAKIHRVFTLPVTDIAAYEANGLPMDLSNVATVALEAARMEDDLIFNGSEDLGTEGLLDAEGIHSVDLNDWDDVGMAASDIINAVTTLDEAGFHGPYNLALAPKNYNLLYRRYERGQMTELDHVSKIVARLVKAPGIEKGGVVVNDGPQYASIALGQDLMTGFIGPVGTDYELSMSESIALRLLQPKAICVLK